MEKTYLFENENEIIEQWWRWRQLKNHHFISQNISECEIEEDW